MAESNATQVILTDDGIKIIKAQSTADNAAGGVANLNDPNLMSVVEKQTQASQYAGLTSQYNVILKRAKDASISTTDLTTAYTNLNTFMTTILTDTTKASNVDRSTYKSLIDAYNTALSNVQTALSNSYNKDISNMKSSVSAASQAASSAATVASKAATTGNSASQTASQAASAANQASADYKALSAGVKDGSVVHITTKTVIDDAVIGTAEIANAAITDAKIGNVSANKLTAGTIDFNTITGKNINASNITTGTLDTNRLNVGKLSALSANLGDVTTGSLKGVDIVANTFSTPNGSFTTDSNGNVVASNLIIRGVTNLVYNAALLGGNGPNVPGWSLSNNGYCTSNVTHDGVSSIGFNNTVPAGAWNLLAQTKLYQLKGTAGQSFSASVWFLEINSDTSLKYSFTLAFFDSNGSRINGGYVEQAWNGIRSRQNWRYVTINNAVAPSNAAYVGLQYWAYNGKGNAYFSSPMLTQTAQATGYQPDTGNVVSAGEIDGSVINGSTINGTTFNAGTKLNQYGNTSYPMTISSDGSLNSTTFKSIANETAALRASLKDGIFRTNLRGMTPFATGKYSAADTALGAGQLALHEGYSTSQDANFTNNSLTSTGYVIVDASNGMTLHGDNQQITFNGTSADVTPKGIIITPYGNINPNGTQNIWYVGNGPTMKTASFGIDGSGANNIQFNRSLDIGNFNINTYHSITSSDNGPIHFNQANGNPVDIYASAVHYDSLVKSSLLSVKRDVRKADTAYWAQLVNSVDLATYQYKTDDNTSHLRLSSIVDDVNDTKQWQLPDVFISRDENGKLNGVDDSVLLNATLATVQEQQKQISALNGHLLELEAKLNG
ncbi:phage tail protein [Pediococcus acidilactici]